MPEPAVLVVGSTMIDLIAYADRLPGDGETLVGTEFRMGFGGKGANQAVAAARLGARVALANTVGDDSYGASYLENLDAQGVDTTWMRRVPGSSGVAPIWVDGRGMNRIIIVPGANLAMPPALGVEAVQAILPSVVVGQFEVPQGVTAAAFSAARDVGAITVLNPAPAETPDPAVIAVTDWLVPNEHEFALLGGGVLDGDDEAEAAQIRAFGARLGVAVVVTLGERGAKILPRDGELVAVPPVPVRPVDTTGAGDAFVGGFAVGLARGWDPVDAARLGAAFAGDSVTRPGTQTSFATREAAAGILASIRG
jgi:ribokinase